MEILTYTVPPEEDGVCVRHILKAKLHFSTPAVARLTRAEDGIRVNGVHARTVDPVHAGDVVAVRSDDLRPLRIPLGCAHDYRRLGRRPRGDERPKLRFRRLDRNLRRLLLLKAPRPATPVGCI